ncbi:glycosyltransferase family 39 protein [Patescibacteria group bacterium]|nr:glycosyltransferase family 39 protein [Patescibacteria group bacterium]
MLKVASFLRNYYLLGLIIIFSGFLRFGQLGYSHFYGDESKTFYLNKTIPAFNFFLDQRKGPIQFLVVWSVEKLTGSHDELYTRLPFALAGTVCIVVAYFLAKKLFNTRVGLVAASLFGLNGFLVAFSRTAQYQSFLILFGLLSILFAIFYYYEKVAKRRIAYALISSVCLALAYLSHYDAVFYDVVVGFVLLSKVIESKGFRKRILTETFFYYLLPFVAVAGVFYIPYIYKGYFVENTSGYLMRRVTGNEYASNFSAYTFWVYNPSILWPFVFLFALTSFFTSISFERKLLFLWFIIPLIVMEPGLSNPGTHILNYYVPLLFLTSVGLVDFYDWVVHGYNWNKKTKLILITLFSTAGVTLFSYLFILNLLVYIPKFNAGYPWNKANKNFHLFLYGFPYNRGWDQISTYIKQKGGVRSVYTNDNDVVAQYYLYGIDYTPPGPNYLPQYYIHVFQNQEFTNDPPVYYEDFLSFYDKEKEFMVEGNIASVLYKKKNLHIPIVR